MPVSDGYLTYVLDQLRPIVPGVRVRRMFGGVGLYATDLFFAVIDDDVLYLKVDDATRGEYEARGMPPFSPIEGHASMNYSQLPEEILEEREELHRWTSRSLDVARSAKRTRTTRKGTKKGAAKKSAPKTRPAKGAAKKTVAKKRVKRQAATKRRS